jgi:type II secretory pathway pseudopilin PulG
MSRRHRLSAEEGSPSASSNDGQRSETGDTLVEILVAITVVGIAAVALLLAFATSITGSGDHRNQATFNTMLTTATAELTAAVQNNLSGYFTTACSGAQTINNSSSSAIPLASPYTASISSVQYWNGTAFLGQTSPTGSCPTGALSNGPQVLTITVSNGASSSSTTTVVENTQAPTGGSSCSGTPDHLVFLQQPGNGTSGSAFFPIPIVAVEDASDNVVCTDLSQVSIAITANTGTSGATLKNCSPSPYYGETIFANCSISTTGNGYTLTASDTSDGLTPANTTVTSGQFNITAGAPAQLVFTTEPGNGLGGSALMTQPEVTIEDSGGNTVTTDTSTLTLAIGSNPSGGTLTGCTSTTTSGVAMFAGCAINKIGTGYTLTATDATDNLTTPSLPSNSFKVTLGPPAQLVFKTSPGASITGQPFPSASQPVVDVEDLGGNLETGNTSTVTLAIGANPGGGVLSGCSGTTTGGVATFSGCSINQAGTGYTLTASDGTLQQATTSAFTVSAAALTSFRVTPSTTTPTAGAAFSATITALDQGGNAFTGLTGPQTLTFTGPGTSPDGNAPTYPASVTFANGVGTATPITLYDAQAVTLTVAQGTASGSASLTVGGSTATTFTVANPGTQTAGTHFNLTITATDAYGNAANYTGTKTITFTGAGTSPNGNRPTYPASVTFNASGVGTATITLFDAQTNITLTATQGGITGTSGAFTVGPAAAGAFTVSNPGTQTAGTPFSVTITAVDTYGNAANYTGAKTITFSGPGTSPKGNAPVYPASVTFNANGVGTATPITLYDAQAATALTATQGAITGTSTPFAVNGLSTVSAFTITNPGTQTAGTAFNVTITTTDAYGNTANYTGTQTITFTGPGTSTDGNAPTYPASVSFSAGVGTANMTFYDAQTSTTLTATAGALTGTSTAFAVNNAVASSFTVANPGTQTAGTHFNLTITATDAYGNAANYTGTKTITFTGAGTSPNGNRPTYPASVTFNASGVGTATITLFDAQTNITLTATQGGITGTSGAFTVGPAAAGAFTVSNPGTQTAGTPFSVTITAVDTYGNAANYTGAKTITFSGPGTSPKGNAPVYPASVTFNANGVGTATPITLYDAQAATALTATQGAITGTSTPFAVNGLSTEVGIGLANITTNTTPAITCTGAVGSLTCTSAPNTGRTLVAGLQLEDQYGNAVVNAVGTITIALTENSGSNGSSLTPASLTIANGASATTKQFTLVRGNNGGGGTKQVTMTATVNGKTPAQTLTVQLTTA